MSPRPPHPSVDKFKSVLWGLLELPGGQSCCHTLAPLLHLPFLNSTCDHSHQAHKQTRVCVSASPSDKLLNTTMFVGKKLENIFKILNFT